MTFSSLLGTWIFYNVEKIFLISFHLKHIAFDLAQLLQMYNFSTMEQLTFREKYEEKVTFPNFKG